MYIYVRVRNLYNFSIFFKGVNMKYQPAINIWNIVPAGRVKDLQAGQWVYAGDKEDKGIFLGVKPSGTIVCAWYRNAKNSKDFKGYVKSLRQYALAG
jgi:hypothetical protein